MKDCPPAQKSDKLVESILGEKEEEEEKETV